MLISIRTPKAATPRPTLVNLAPGSGCEAVSPCASTYPAVTCAHEFPPSLLEPPGPALGGVRHVQVVKSRLLGVPV